MQETLQKYFNAFKRIKRANGTAPHKPILLLSVLQTFQNGISNTPQIFISPELVALFKSNWNLLVITNHDCRISYPFYYLKSDKFWKLIPKSGFQDIDSIGSAIKSFVNLNAAIDHAVIEEDLFNLMIDKNSNLILQQFLLDYYFPNTKNNCINSVIEQQKHFDEIENKILQEPSAEYKQEIQHLILQKDEEEIFLRGSLFKREIPKIYNNTCCISGMKIDATLNISMIDACHIVPFSVSYDDTITNGIALCPNLHRAFDRGLISVDEHYRVIVSNSFREDSTNYSIKTFENKKINLPLIENYLPAKENFQWHLDNIFKK